MDGDRSNLAKEAREAPSDAIRFLLDGEVHTLRNVDPNTTVLDYLREELGRKGTKEGCAEGDCGACTVVVNELVDGEVRCRTINSCIQFLPTLDGKELWTVESLRRPDGRLHAVQEAMVDAHGSQCGFCTPGFVMSLLEVYKTTASPTRSQVQDALAGNLCRCTGYRPIVEAALEMAKRADRSTDRWIDEPRNHRDPDEDDGPTDAERRVVGRLRELRREGSLKISGPDFYGGQRSFYAPTTVSELATLVLEHPDGHLLAGGTDIGLWVTKQRRDLDPILYLGNVAELQRIDQVGGHIEIGAAVTITDAMAPLGEHYPSLGELFRRFASPPIRNAATLVGNIANGSPIGDSMPALIALGSDLVLRRGDDTRQLPLDAFYLGYQQTAMEPGEFIEQVRVPVPAKAQVFRTYKVSKRFDQDISAVCGAFSAFLHEGVLRDVRVCFGGMAATPKRAFQCESVLEGQSLGDTALEAGMAALDADYEPIDDLRATKRYRQLVARNLLRRYFLDLESPVEILAGG